ncbi:hypothetical protein OSB04_017634 [Centaurea solstitialis]|uniref:PGG domain-containing protein n=1 Tax=Centaurea solstitialis TaxID=347529 RepID=A0AA38T391_9ASTR|nr:hypothetical protein OSB04_017634 [Centaurea solstitialis]
MEPERDRATDKDRIMVRDKDMEPEGSERDMVREKERDKDRVRDMEPEGYKVREKVRDRVRYTEPEGYKDRDRDKDEKKKIDLLTCSHNTTTEDNRDERYFSICVPLYEASLIGDWDAAYALLGPHPEYVTYAIDMDYSTPLHVAAYAQETEQTKDFVEKLVNLMTREQLKLKNRFSNNACCVAASFGNMGIVTSMVKKNNELVNILGSGGHPPLHNSAKQGRHETLRYLYRRSPNLDNIEYWRDDKRKVWLLKQCVEYGFFDVALQIVSNHPQLAVEGSVLGVLAKKTDAFKQDCTRCCDNDDDDAWRLLKRIWRDNIMRKPTDEVDNILKGPRGRIIRHEEVGHHVYAYPSRILFVATEMGNTLFVVELLRAYPGLRWMTNDDDMTIFHVAAMHRHLGIFNLLYELGKRKNTISVEKDKNGNTMLHLIAMTSKNVRDETSGASLVMQRELLWFKEVENMMLASFREHKNNRGETAYQIFFEQNRDVISQGVKWMRDCMVVATLIVTVAFAVAFTVPGGYNQESATDTVPSGNNQGAAIPIFIHKPSFLVFVIADAISLSSASTSLIMFLSLLISRHSQRDFIHSLPKKLMIGLITLFISVASMMVTFSASFFVLYNKDLKWVPITIAVLVSIPVFTFIVQQAHVMWDMIGSMLCSRYLFNPMKHKLYKRR